VPNIRIYLHAKFHILLRSLSIFPEFISLLCIWKIPWKKKRKFIPSRAEFTAPAQPTHGSRTAPLSLPPLTAKWALVPLWPSRQPLAICTGPVCQELLPRNPPPLSRAMLPSPAIHCCCTPSRRPVATAQEPVPLVHSTMAALSPHTLSCCLAPLRSTQAPPATHHRCDTTDAQS
jgi:hypothetical protein